MRVSKTLNNIYQDVIQYIIKYNYIIFPALVFTTYILTYYFTKFKIHTDLRQNICNISGVLAGFLFTAHSIILALPGDKKFINLLKEYGYFKIMFINIFLGEITLIISLILSLFNLAGYISLLTFLVGLTYTVILAIILFSVSLYVVK